ncbi:MAG: DNA polymerase III subunit gamma/tau [Thermomicrobiales bacterium]|nr:DNA polymerase III subunit gamma/tau [Thermomicrobiales bacterium]
MSNPALFGAADESSASETPASNPTGDAGNGGTQSLYRKFRPQSFDEHELVGQDAIVRTLRNAVRTNRVAHAYLFSGPRGTGKTTTARLLAKAVNCTHPDPEARPCNECAACRSITEGSAIDVVEIDAASNRGIDDIRELRERVKFAPAQLRTKFYIIDEAHQITGAAANAFLKTLEEPPPHTRFVLATTDPEQILPTIVSRCQRFEFKRIPVDAARQRLALVAEQEHLSIDPRALDLIARQGGGSLRDALGLLDQVSAFRRQSAGESEQPISVDDVRDLIGLSRDEMIVQLAAALGRRDAAEALSILHRATDDGADPRQINRQLVQFLRSVMHFLADPRSTDDGEVARVASFFTLGEVMSEAERFSEIDFKVRHNMIPQLPLEIGIVGSVLRDGAPGARPAPPAAPDQPRPITPPTPIDLAARSQPVESPPPTPIRPPAAEPSPPPARSGSLADRVRAGQPASAPAAPPAASEPPAVAPGGEPVAVSIEQVRANWEQIRATLKSRSRRIEALLLSVDPASVSGNLLTLTSAYPFHRNKLNETDVQAAVEEAVNAVLGSKLRITTLLHGEAPIADSRVAGMATETTATTTSRPAASERTTTTTLAPEDLSVLETVKNFFDAEEIEP